VFERAKQPLRLDLPYGKEPLHLCLTQLRPPLEEQMILRMMILSPDSYTYEIPDDMLWITPMLVISNMVQSSKGIHRPYVYVTIRNGYVSSVDDDVWHVDGFSMRVPHRPEQDYIWSNHTGTQILNQEFIIPSDFDPNRHNLHYYFQDRADESKISVLNSKHIYVMDPYVIHRRDPSLQSDIWRTFVRISYLPIEIEDDTCTPNPMIPRQPYNRYDIRNTLGRYNG